MYKLHGQITREFLGLRMRNFQTSLYMNTNIYGDFQICISVPLKASFTSEVPRQSFCRTNLTILCNYIKQTFCQSLAVTSEECLTQVTGKGIMKLVKLSTKFNPEAVFFI